MPKTRNIKLLAGVLILSAIAWGGCTKKPVACIVSDKNDYKDGETMHLSSCSENAKSFTWTLTSDYFSRSYTTETADVTLDYYDQNNVYYFNPPTGQLTIKLEVESKNGKKKDSATETVNIKRASADVVFYSNSSISFFTPSTISFNNVVIGTITDPISTLPYCGAVGCVTKSFETGNQEVSYTQGTYIYTKSFTVVKNKCNSVPIY